METGKPLVSVVLAVYEPNLSWLGEQLTSLEEQTYPNLELLVCDDCSPTVQFEEIYSCVRKHISSFSFELYRNSKNLGSNKTFEWLTLQAKGRYIAYCDQDDIWLPEKLSVLVQEAERTGALLVCSDMYVIDSEGRVQADSITKVRRHHVFHSGMDLAEGLVFKNFVTGCTMLVEATSSKAAVPFCPYMVHDHYIALFCSMRGMIRSLSQPFIRYRIHKNNQTGMLAGVTDKKSYCDIRIDLALQKMHWLIKHCDMPDSLRETICQGILWLEARKKNLAGDKWMIREIWKYRKFSVMTSLFEIVAGALPERVFMFLIRLVQSNRI